jgi:CheY-like chemotaxis protein
MEQKKEDIDILLGEFIAKLNTLSIDIQLAQHKSREINEKHKVRPTQATRTSQTKKHILAVDDVPVILNVLKRIIDGEKYKFSGLTSGEAVLRYLDTHTPPDLFVVDIEMPNMNGYELTKSIVAKGYDVPIIFLTSNATRGAVIKALQAGATDFLVKPIDEELILSRLKRYLV